MGRKTGAWTGGGTGYAGVAQKGSLNVAGTRIMTGAEAGAGTGTACRFGRGNRIRPGRHPQFVQGPVDSAPWHQEKQNRQSSAPASTNAQVRIRNRRSLSSTVHLSYPGKSRTSLAAATCAAVTSAANWPATSPAILSARALKDLTSCTTGFGEESIG